jgi:putative PIN family toxin of toxin-antitoxin system
MRVVLDTCVFVAAVRSRRGASFALLSEIPHGQFRFGISIPLYTEYCAKLIDASSAGVTPLTPRQIDAILGAIAHFGSEVPIYFQLRPNLKDENDNMVFECAANFQAKVIVTHNIKDFLNPELKGYGIEPITPGEFIHKVRRKT